MAEGVEVGALMAYTHDSIEFDRDEADLIGTALCYAAMEPGFDTIRLSKKQRRSLACTGHHLLSLAHGMDKPPKPRKSPA